MASRVRASRVGLELVSGIYVCLCSCCTCACVHVARVRGEKGFKGEGWGGHQG